MKTSLKKKFIWGFFLIFFASSIILNLLIRSTLDESNNRKIKDSMISLMQNSREFIKQQLILERNALSKDAFKESAYSIAVKLSVLNNCYVALRNTDGELIEAINTGIDRIALNYNDDIRYAAKGKSYIYLQQYGKKLIVHLAYPVYLNDKYVGIASFKLDYSQMHVQNRKLVDTITIMQLAALILAFIFSYCLVSKIIKPLKVLTSCMEDMTNGLYERAAEVKSNDEIGVLAAKFNTMRIQIKDYIDNIQKEKEKVVKLEATRKEFFNNVTHELKTPLTGISAYAQILSDSSVDDVEFQTRAARRIKEESDRLHKMVLDLIEVSKGNTAVKEEYSSINVRSMLEDIITDLSPKFNEHNLKVQCNIDDLNINAAYNMIKQLIINILDNVVKYSCSGSTVLVNSFCEESVWVLEVINRSPRIPDNILKNIFEPFVKGENSNDKGSSGLGLYICRNIAEQHGGSIEVFSEDYTKTIVKIPAAETLWKQPCEI